MDMKMLELQLTDEEDRRHESYPDTEGLWTCGIGHHDATLGPGIVWDDAKIDAVFQADVTEKAHQVAAACPWYIRLSDPRQAVLIEMCFQMGLQGLLGFTNALAAMRDERWHDAAGHMLASKWALQTPARAQRMARQIETGEWQITRAA